MDITTFQTAIQSYPNASRLVIQGNKVVDATSANLEGVSVEDKTNTTEQEENRTFALSFLTALYLKYPQSIVDTTLANTHFSSMAKEGSPFSASLIKQVLTKVEKNADPSASSTIEQTLRTSGAALGGVGVVATVADVFSHPSAVASLHFLAVPAASTAHESVMLGASYTATAAAAVTTAHAAAASSAASSGISALAAAHPGAVVIIPLVALAAGSGRMARLCTTVREQAMVIGGGVVGSAITAHPSAGAMWSVTAAGITAHPFLIPAAAVGGGTMMVLNKDLRNTGATIIGGGAAGAYFAAHPAAGVAFIEKTSSAIVHTFSAIGSSINSVAHATSSALATTSTAHASSAAAVSIVPYSSTTVSSIASHTGSALAGAHAATLGATALKATAVAAATVAAHPIVLGGAVATGLYMLAQKSSGSTEVTTEAVNVNEGKILSLEDAEQSFKDAKTEFQRLKELSLEDRKKYEGSSYRDAVRDARNNLTDARYAFLSAGGQLDEKDEIV